MIVLDTNVVSELARLRPDPRALSWVESQDREDIYVTVITVAELCHGVALIPDQTTRQRVSRDNEPLLSLYFTGRILNLDEAAAREYADILAQIRTGPMPVDAHDCMIAAIALVNGAPVATRNVRDFRRCGVSVINPWEAAANQ